jgi:hypothetical protein
MARLACPEGPVSFSLQRDSPSLADRLEARFGYRNPHVHFKIALATIPAIEYRPATGRHLTRTKGNAVKDFTDNE